MQQICEGFDAISTVGTDRFFRFFFRQMGYGYRIPNLKRRRSLHDGAQGEVWYRMVLKGEYLNPDIFEVGQHAHKGGGYHGGCTPHQNDDGVDCPVSWKIFACDGDGAPRRGVDHYGEPPAHHVCEHGAT